jgi:protein-disulfide isomerase
MAEQPKLSKEKVLTKNWTIFILVLVIVALLAIVLRPRERIISEEVARILNENPRLVLQALEGAEGDLFRLVQAGQEEYIREEEDARILAEMADPFQPEVDPSRIMRGDPDAPVTIVVYSSFQCSYCSIAATTVEELMARHPGRFRMIYKHHPQSGLAQLEAYLFEGIALQSEELAWEFHDIAFERRAEIANNERLLEEIVMAMPLDQDKLTAAMQGDVLSEIIARDKAEFDEFGFRGTPVFLLNGVSLRGNVPLEAFERLADLVQGLETIEEPCDECGEQE